MDAQLYAVLGQPDGRGRWQLRLWWKPYVTFIWLGGVLKKAKGADHVFLFLHHPRWLKKFEKADYGDVMLTLGITERFDDFAEQITRVERELLWARDKGVKIPDYVAAAFREARELSEARLLGQEPAA